MTFIKFQDFNAPVQGKVSKTKLIETLLAYETKDANKVNALVMGLDEMVEFSTATSLFSNKLQAVSVLRMESNSIKEANNTEILDLVDSIHKIIKELKEDPNKDSKKTSKLFNDAKPLVARLHSLVESVNGYDGAHSIIKEFNNDIAPTFESAAKLNWDSLIEKINLMKVEESTITEATGFKIGDKVEITKFIQDAENDETGDLYDFNPGDKVEITNIDGKHSYQFKYLDKLPNERYWALRKEFKANVIKESVITEEEDYSDEMSFGQLESCIDNSNMIRDRIKQGVSLDPWMHSQIAVAKNELTSVFDALDGDDGVVE